MNEAALLWGIPLPTVLIGGGLFILSTFLPTIIAAVLKRKDRIHE